MLLRKKTVAKRKNDGIQCRRFKASVKGMLCFCAAVVLALTAGCTADQPAPPAGAKKAAPEKPAKPEKAPGADTAVQGDRHSQEAGKEYSYDATGKADPFEPLVAAIEPTKQASAAVRVKSASDKPLTPLQKYDLSDLFLVAVISTDNNTAALVEDNARNGYIVREGMVVGKNDGVIKKILKNSMIVEEKITDSTGNTETKISTLTVHKKD